MSELEIDDNNSLYYVHHEPDAGKPTFVFVNALTGNTEAWEQIVAPACRAQGFGTLSYNMRGQINTKLGDGVVPDCNLIVEDLALLVNTLKPQAPVFCGLSIGGLFAARAILNGVDAHGLILLNTLREIGPRLKWLNEGMVHVLDTGGFGLMMDMYLPLLTNENFHGPKRKDHLKGEGYTPEDKNSGLYRLMKAAGSADWDFSYEDLTLPVLTITGLQDRVFYDPTIFAKLADRLPNAEHTHWQNAGHLLTAEAPDELAQALIKFGEKNPGS